MIVIASCKTFVHEERPLANDDRLLLEALTARGIAARVVRWDDPSVRWEQADLVVLRSTWDYFHRVPAFLRWVNQVQQVSRLVNPSPAITWNLDKRYLRALEAHGAPLIPTLWLEPGKPYDLAALLDGQQWPVAVLKPTIGANSRQVVRFDASQAFHAQQHLAAIFARDSGAMLQPYLPTISTEGERSHVFLGGQWSHAFARTPFQPNRPGHQLSGQISEAVDVPTSEIELARRMFAAIEAETNTRLCYARIDLVAGAEGQRMLMEAEIIEPVLRLEAPGARERLVGALQECMDPLARHQSFNVNTLAPVGR